MKASVQERRSDYLKSFFPHGTPSLWCPLLTHYDGNGRIDRARMAAHLSHLSPYVGGFLIPGSTGDGWELTRDERQEAVRIGVEQAKRLNRQVLVGALNADTAEALALIEEDLRWLKSEFLEPDIHKLLAQAHICGFTICPPRGRGLTQDDLGRALRSVLELDLPTAIYQLPQVTLNEMSPELVAALAASYGNFVFFKDTSGTDAVTGSGKDLGGVFAIRGAEGDYARWLKASGGSYDGLLLSSANCFARELAQIISDASAGRAVEARQLSDRVSAAVLELFRRAEPLPHGNPFANANKAADHFFAYGPRATAVPPPRLHAGTQLPADFIQAAEEILLREHLMPATGYSE